MIRLFFRFIVRLLFGTHWRFPQFVVAPARLLYEAALGLSNVFIGRQGSAKTFTVAQELLEQMKAHPEQPFFIFDWSGGLIITLFLLILSDPKRDELLARLIYDDMGGRTINGEPYIMPLPEFSEKYDPEKRWLERIEDQIDRVQRVFTSLNEELIERNPTMGGRPINELLPNILALLNAITDEKGESFQLTEATQLLNKDVRENARKRFGYKVGKANEYFREQFTGDSKLEKDQAHALADVLDVIKTQRIRARVGYPDPGWTPHEVVTKGQIYCGDGSSLGNNQKQKDFAYVSLFHLILDEINKRVPSAPGYPPVNWVMDEIYTFIEKEIIARMLTHFVTEYRNRKLQLFFVVQTLKQLPGEANGKKGLEDLFFSFGNIVVFQLLDIDDCLTVAKNFFPFDPQLVKVPAQRDGQHDIMKNRDEQLAEKAYQLQHLAKRECYVRRFIDEARMDKIIHIGKTRDVRITATREDVERLKDRLMLERGVPLAKAEKTIAQRKVPGLQPTQQTKNKKARKPESV
jgi:hypothetical protein